MGKQDKFGLIKTSKTHSKLSLAMLFDSSSPVISHLIFVIYHLSYIICSDQV